jgi:hypothetical protein
LPPVCKPPRKRAVRFPLLPHRGRRSGGVRGVGGLVSRRAEA